MADDFRIRVEFADRGGSGFLDRLRAGLSDEAEQLARELSHHRLAVSHDEDSVFVYADTPEHAGIARQVVLHEVERHAAEAEVSEVERWLAEEERWSSDPAGETWEAQYVERGFAPWEVRIETASQDEADRLADSLEGEGYEPLRRWRYLIVGTATREEAEALAARTHGTVELGGEVVHEVSGSNPFAIFG